MLINFIVFLAGFLVFQIQPLAAKMILPLFGGGASIWLSSLFFFQVSLLLGYWLSHLGRQRLKTRTHMTLEVLFLLLSFALLPLGLNLLPDLAIPLPLQIFALLGLSLGLPFLVLSTLSPLVQHWLSLDPSKEGKNPYLLYGSSNLGSLLGLLSYPLLFEPYFTLTEQRWIWSGAYGFLSLLILIFVAALWRRVPIEASSPAGSPRGLSQKLKWLYLAFLPSVALMAITQYLTRDIVNFPFLWVVPLSLYLFSFVLVFYFPVLSRPNKWKTFFCCLPLWVLLLYNLSPYYLAPHLSLLYPTILGCLALFALALHMHGDLEYQKPPAEELTTFYLYLCLGGALGGFFVSFLTPLLFASTYEFYLVLWLGIITLSIPYGKDWSPFRRMAYFSTLMALFTINFVMEMTDWHPQVIHRDRSYYNTYKVSKVTSKPLFRLAREWKEELNFEDLTEDLRKKWQTQGISLSQKATVKTLEADQRWVIADGKKQWFIKAEKLNLRVYEGGPSDYSQAQLLIQGTTIHGGQIQTGDGKYKALTYYHSETGINDIFKRFSFQRVGVVGLGIGVVSLFGKKGQEMDFYEIDPMVERIARDHFDLLNNCPAKVRIILGDGRKKLEEIEKNHYDLLLLDAFTSDAVPTHLLTIEALEEYLRILKPKGILLFNISNRYLELTPVFRGATEKLDLYGAWHLAPKDRPHFKFAAVWVALTPSKETFKKLVLGHLKWRSFPPEKVYWRDEHHFLWPLIRWD